MATKPFGGKQGANWKHSGMTAKRYDALKKAHDAAAMLRRGSGKAAATTMTKKQRIQAGLPPLRPKSGGVGAMLLKSQAPKVRTKTVGQTLSSGFASGKPRGSSTGSKGKSTMKGKKGYEHFVGPGGKISF